MSKGSGQDLIGSSGILCFHKLLEGSEVIFWDVCAVGRLSLATSCVIDSCLLSEQVQERSPPRCLSVCLSVGQSFPASVGPARAPSPLSLRLGLRVAPGHQDGTLPAELPAGWIHQPGRGFPPQHRVRCISEPVTLATTRGSGSYCSPNSLFP